MSPLRPLMGQPCLQEKTFILVRLAQKSTPFIVLARSEAAFLADPDPCLDSSAIMHEQLDELATTLRGAILWPCLAGEYVDLTLEDWEKIKRCAASWISSACLGICSRDFWAN